MLWGSCVCVCVCVNVCARANSLGQLTLISPLITNRRRPIKESRWLCLQSFVENNKTLLAPRYGVLLLLVQYKNRYIFIGNYQYHKYERIILQKHTLGTNSRLTVLIFQSNIVLRFSLRLQGYLPHNEHTQCTLIKSYYVFSIVHSKLYMLHIKCHITIQKFTFHRDLAQKIYMMLCYDSFASRELPW